MKYCTNCGTGLSDDAAFCANCGFKQEDTTNASAPTPIPATTPTPAPATTPVANAAAQAPYQGAPVYNNYVMPNSAPKKSKTPLIIGIIAVIVCVLGVVFFMQKGSASGYEAPIKNFCDAINHRDADKLCKAFSPSVESMMKLSLSFVDEDELWDQMFGDVSADFKVDYKINGAEPMDSYDLDSYQSSLGDDVISDGYYVDVTLYITSDGYTEEEDDELAIVKVGNRWCFADMMF